VTRARKIYSEDKEKELMEILKIQKIIDSNRERENERII